MKDLGIIVKKEINSRLQKVGNSIYCFVLSQAKHRLQCENHELNNVHKDWLREQFGVFEQFTATNVCADERPSPFLVTQ